MPSPIAEVLPSVLKSGSEGSSTLEDAGMRKGNENSILLAHRNKSMANTKVSSMSLGAMSMMAKTMNPMTKRASPCWTQDLNFSPQVRMSRHSVEGWTSCLL